MYSAVVDLLEDAGVRVVGSARVYRPEISLERCEVKALKPQNIVEMLDLGSRDFGFTGADWMSELGGSAVELLDTGLDPVRVVAAAPAGVVDERELSRRAVVVASEYQQLARRWIRERGLEARFVRSYGATEVFPPEDADVIVDNTATGSTLAANGLVIVDELMTSSTRLYANSRALDDPEKGPRIENLRMLLESVLEARGRVMVELNAPGEQVEVIAGLLPCMRDVTVSPLMGDRGYALRAAIPRVRLPEVIPALKAAGGTDVVVSQIGQIVP